MAGVITMVIGVSGIVSGAAETKTAPRSQVEVGAAPQTAAPEPELTPAQQADQTACAQWLSAYDRERDPNRRASLRAAAPTHCSSFLPPAK